MKRHREYSSKILTEQLEYIQGLHASIAKEDEKTLASLDNRLPATKKLSLERAMKHVPRNVLKMITETAILDEQYIRKTIGYKGDIKQMLEWRRMHNLEHDYQLMRKKISARQDKCIELITAIECVMGLERTLNEKMMFLKRIKKPAELPKESTNLFRMIPTDVVHYMFNLFDPITLFKFACVDKYLNYFATQEKLWEYHVNNSSVIKELKFNTRPGFIHTSGTVVSKFSYDSSDVRMFGCYRVMFAVLTTYPKKCFWCDTKLAEIFHHGSSAAHFICEPCRERCFISGPHAKV